MDGRELLSARLPTLLLASGERVAEMVEAQAEGVSLG